MLRWTRTAHLVSDFTSPPVLAVPTFTVLSLYDMAQHGGGDFFDLLARLFFSITFGVTLPSVYIIYLYRRHKVTDLHISVRQQRNLPYLVGIMCYAVGFGLIYWLIGPGVLAAAMLINTVMATVVALINLGWKISAHATGIAIPLAILTWLFGWLVAPLFILIPVIGWARVYIKAHTLAQVVAGTIISFVVTLLLLAFWFQPMGWV